MSQEGTREPERTVPCSAARLTIPATSYLKLVPECEVTPRFLSQPVLFPVVKG